MQHLLEVRPLLRREKDVRKLVRNHVLHNQEVVPLQPEHHRAHVRRHHVTRFPRWLRHKLDEALEQLH